jgi:hypothetical protein
MVVLWIVTDYLSAAYNGWILPLLGFFFLPTTTLAYAIAQNEMRGPGIRGWGVILMVVAVLFDLGIWGKGRGVFSRD